MLLNYLKTLWLFQVLPLEFVEWIHLRVIMYYEAIPSWIFHSVPHRYEGFFRSPALGSRHCSPAYGSLWHCSLIFPHIVLFPVLAVSLHVFMLRLTGNLLQSSRILLGMALSSLVLLSCGLELPWFPWTVSSFS